MPPLSEALSSEMFLIALCIPFPEGHSHASPQGLVDLVRGDEACQGETGCEVRREA